MYIIFDCTKGFGHSGATRYRWTAHMLAVWLSFRTSRFHDYEPAHKPFARLKLRQRQA